MRRALVCLGLSGLAIVGGASCGGDDTQGLLPEAGEGSEADGGLDATTSPAKDAATGVDAADASDGSVPSLQDGGADAEPDAAHPLDASVASFLLLSYGVGGDAGTQYSAFETPANHVVGSLAYAQYATGVATSESPWLLEQASNRVVRMNPAAPWEPTAIWNVSEPPDASSASTEAVAVVEVGTKAYVAGYASDYVAVLDTSQASDGGPPIASISLTSFVADADIDHRLEVVALASDATQRRVWVVLGNSNNGADPSNGAYVPCSPGFHPLVVAIDTATDTLVPGVEYALSGYDVLPALVAYDAALDRLLVASKGCVDVSDAGHGSVSVGPTVQSYVEALSLAADAGTDTILLNPAPPSPSALVYVDEHHAYLQSASGVNAWDPTLSALGPSVPGAPDVFVVDAQGNLLGPRTTSFADGGSSIAVVAVDPLLGTSTTLATNPFAPAPAPASWHSVALWPPP
jgi:hypothetical protein